MVTKPKVCEENIVGWIFDGVPSVLNNATERSATLPALLSFTHYTLSLTLMLHSSHPDVTAGARRHHFRERDRGFHDHPHHTQDIQVMHD